jgi:putative sterol carrier protein
MTDPEALGAVLAQFARACSENERLCQMNRDWFRTIAIRPEDLGREFWLRSEGGPVRMLSEPPEGEPDLVVEAPADVLAAVFGGEAPPTQPYMDGTLRVRGHQDDLMRLDIISLLIWGE